MKNFSGPGTLLVLAIGFLPTSCATRQLNRQTQTKDVLVSFPNRGLRLLFSDPKAPGKICSCLAKREGLSQATCISEFDTNRDCVDSLILERQIQGVLEAVLNQTQADSAERLRQARVTRAELALAAYREARANYEDLPQKVLQETEALLKKTVELYAAT